MCSRRIRASAGWHGTCRGVSSTADAAAFTWQGYSRDSSWNCGPSGSTKYVNGVYLLACVKTAGADWQAILIATTTSKGSYISDRQDEWVFSGGHSYDVSTGWCGPIVYAGHAYIPANTTVACFSPTMYNPSSLVEGEFNVNVTTDFSGSGQSADWYSPGAWTTS